LYIIIIKVSRRLIITDPLISRTIHTHYDWSISSMHPFSITLTSYYPSAHKWDCNSTLREEAGVCGISNIPPLHWEPCLTHRKEWFCTTGYFEATIGRLVHPVWPPLLSRWLGTLC